MRDFGILIGIAAIILALFFGAHLMTQDEIAKEKLKKECVCNERCICMEKITK